MQVNVTCETVAGTDALNKPRVLVRVIKSRVIGWGVGERQCFMFSLQKLWWVEKLAEARTTLGCQREPKLWQRLPPPPTQPLPASWGKGCTAQLWEEARDCPEKSWVAVLRVCVITDVMDQATLDHHHFKRATPPPAYRNNMCFGLAFSTAPLPNILRESPTPQADSCPKRKLCSGLGSGEESRCTFVKA